MITLEGIYLSTLRNEVQTLKTEYCDPQAGGTDNFSIAISVLEQRIKEIQNGKPIQVHID